MMNLRSISCLAAIACLALLAGPEGPRAQCPEEPPLQNFTGAGTVACPCFVEGEQAGAVLTAPPGHYPLEILRIGVGWGSQFGGNPAQIEKAIHVYAGGLPDPGAPVFTLLGPQLNDGVINEYDIEPIPGEVTMSGGPFTVTLEFANDNEGNFFVPTVVHDGNGCQPAKNVVYAIPGGWTDACALGVTGDWVFYVVYRPCVPTGVNDGPFVASASPAFLQLPRPNPFESSTEIGFVLGQPGHADVSVYDVSGRRVARLANSTYPAGAQRVTWNGRDDDGGPLPTGVYFVKLEVQDYTSVRKVLLTK
jgi:hypothetical protein